MGPRLPAVRGLTMPRDIPIIFSKPMVCALLAARTTKRRIYVKRGESPLSLEHLARRIANGLDSAPDGECWEWTRSKNADGYGTITYDGKTWLVHRWAYQLATGVDIGTSQVLHRCDNPPCINPDHLWEGDRFANMSDCFAKGRSSIRPHRMKGETNGSAKLTSRQVIEIRRRLSAGEYQKNIAVEYGVSRSLVGLIGQRIVWTNIENEAFEEGSR